MNSLLNKSQVFLKRNSATILTCVGAAGVIATTVTAVKATPKAMRLIEEAKVEKGEDLTKLETIPTIGAFDGAAHAGRIRVHDTAHILHDPGGFHQFRLQPPAPGKTVHLGRL